MFPGLVLAAVLACVPPDKDPDIVPLDTSTPETTASGLFGPDLVVTDDNVHHFEATWTFARTQTAVGERLSLDWSRVTSDAYDAPHEASTFTSAALVRLGADPDEVERRLGTDELDAVLLDRWGAGISGQTSLRTDDLEGFDPAALVEDSDQTWLFALGDLEGQRFELLVGLVLLPTATQAGTLITVPNGSASVAWQGRIDGDQLRTTGGLGDYTLDWSAITTDGYGKPYNPALATELFVGRYDDVSEADDLGGRLLDLRATSSAWWTAGVAGRSQIALAELQGDDGAFPGFASDAVYVVGVNCSTCLGPAPLWVTGVLVR